MRYVVCTCPSGGKNINDLSSNVFEDFMLIRGVCPSAAGVSVVSGCIPRRACIFGLSFSLSLSLSLSFSMGAVRKRKLNNNRINKQF